MDATDRVGTTGPTAPESAPRVRVAGLAGAVRRGPLVGLALACHPGPALAVTALACALAVGAGLGGPRAALVTAAVLTGQLSVGWCNDAYDARRDARAGRRGKPASDGRVRTGAVWAAAGIALALCVPLSLACGGLAGAVHLAAVAAAWLYNLRLKATALSWLPYVTGFGLLPAAVTLTLPGQPWPRWWTVAAGALLGLAAHLADTLPDIAADRAAGVTGLPHRLGAAGTRLLLPLPLLAAAAVLAFGPPGPVGAGGGAALVLAGAAAVAGPACGRRWRKAALGGAVAAAAVDVGLLALRGSAQV
ncbi:UbiA family prenyltransferase [Streptomyces sp. RB110-1]|uniref:UbiA family prenyltransferase n=1 Tax=unclassified Streptomyces TaxID=2593676 RepID=UPI0018FF235B|nr:MULTISPECIES: UbiA family prenyltransferase [unclassified Streptomyces]MBK0372845.1 UbiA family prenyltransferase [Streptomyces sp. RB110-1]MBK0390787.1 UbiA family prenyltransferase [Streptomyces sp. RB110-2]